MTGDRLWAALLVGYGFILGVAASTVGNWTQEKYWLLRIRADRARLKAGDPR